MVSFIRKTLDLATPLFYADPACMQLCNERERERERERGAHKYMYSFDLPLLIILVTTLPHGGRA